MYKKNIYILSLISLIFFITSCQAVKQGLTGEKKASQDEFLIQKKDPLVLPPDYENLPNPDEASETKETTSDFEKALGTSIEEDSSSSGSSEQSILEKIRSK